MEIPEHKYAIYKWVNADGLSDDEWKDFLYELDQFPKIFSFDGIDEEDKSICFKFHRYVPKQKSDIDKCLKGNRILSSKVMKIIQEKMSGRLYFNINKGFIKKVL